jgi:UDP-2-acetamido-3-amino-2,3-dideoxy-glucuronate N-acetyltransferase
MIVGVPGKQRGFVTRHGHPPEAVPATADMAEHLVCPETGLRYALNEQGELRCLDLDEDSPLPDHLATGMTPYRDLHPRDGG